VLPLASADAAGSVVYIGTLSKILAPAVRIGYAVAPPPVLERMVGHRAALDGCGDSVTEAAIAELFEDGEIQRHVRRMRRVYLERRELLLGEIERRLGGALEVACPAGGMALWADVDPAIDVDRWAERTAEAGVIFEPGRRYAFDGRARSALRLGFAACSSAEMRRGVKAMAAALCANRHSPG
jgi:GntR family transcriptional regulator/MocR family aminotransferase